MCGSQQLVAINNYENCTVVHDILDTYFLPYSLIIEFSPKFSIELKPLKP